MGKPPLSNTPQPLQVRAIPIKQSQGLSTGSEDAKTELKTFSPQHRFFGSRPGALRVSSAKTAPFKSHPTEKTVELGGIKVPIMSQMVKNHHVNLLSEDELSSPDNLPIQLDGVQVPSKSKMVKNHHVNLLPNYEHHIPGSKESPTSFNQPDQSLSTARRPTATFTARRPTGASKSYSKPAEITPVKSSVVQGFRVRGDTTNRIVFLNVDELGFNVDAGSLKLGNSELIPVDGLTSFADAVESDKGQGTMSKDAVDKMVSTHLQHDSSIHEPAELLNIQDTRQFFGAHSPSIPKSSKQSNYRPAPNANYRPTRPSSEASYRPASQEAPDSTYRPARPLNEASYRPASRPESDFNHRPARPAVETTFQRTLTAAVSSHHATSTLNRHAEILSPPLSVDEPKRMIQHKPPKIFFGKTAYTERGHVQDSSRKQSTEQSKSNRRQHSSSSKVSFSSLPSRSSTQNSLPKAMTKSTTPNQRQLTPEQPKKLAQSQFSSFINSPSNQEQLNQHLPTSQQSLSNKSTHRNPQQSLHQQSNQQPQKTSYKQQQPQQSTYNLPQQSAYQQPQHSKQSTYQQQQPQQSTYQQQQPQQSTYQQLQPQQSTYQQQQPQPQPQQSTYQQQKLQQAGVEEVLRQQAAVVQLQQQHATLTQNPYSQPNHFLHTPQSQLHHTPQVPGLQQQQQQIQELLATQLQQQLPQAPHFLPAQQHPSVYLSDSPKHAAGLSQHAHYVSQLQAAQQALGSLQG